MAFDFELEESGIWPMPEVKAEPGTLQTEAERTVKQEDDPEQTVGKESMGQETYTPPKPPPVVESIIGMVGKALRPQPIHTPEEGFITDTDIQTQVQDFLRYIASTSIKVQPVPNAYFKVWTQVVNDEEARPIAGYQPNRKRLVIRTRGASTEYVYIADEQANANAGNGFSLAGGNASADRIELESVREVWAIASSGDNVTLEMIGEYYG